MNQKKTEKNRKKPKTKYACLPCNFFSDDKRGYLKHLETKKHKKKNRRPIFVFFATNLTITPRDSVSIKKSV